MAVQPARAPIFRLSRKARPILPVTYSIRFSTRATSCVGSVCARPPIKSVILDQSTLSGIGNIYADEGLWEARLHFARPAIGISSRKVKELLRVCRDVMQRALEVGGTSFDALYVNVDGRSGYLDIDVERVEGSRAHEGRDCLCRASAMRRQAILRSDLARRALDKQLNGPAHLVAHRHKVGSRSLRGVACA